MANPFGTMHSMLAIKNLPNEHKQKWQQLFNHYVFADGVDWPNTLRACARDISGYRRTNGQRIRQLLLQKLNR